jgi:hypothetical protein
MTFEYRAVILVVTSIGIICVSRSSLRSFDSHGFYRFFAWEAILVLFLINVNYWLLEPFSLS